MRTATAAAASSALPQRGPTDPRLGLSRSHRAEQRTCWAPAPHGETRSSRPALGPHASAAAVLAECGTAPPPAPPCRTGERAPAAIAGSAHGDQGPRYLRNQGQQSLFHRARSDLQSRVEGGARSVGGVDSSRTATAGDRRSGHGPPATAQRAIRTSARPPTSLPVASRLAAPRPHPYPCATTSVPPPWDPGPDNPASRPAPPPLAPPSRLSHSS